jgi:hypothetical protein
VSGFYAPDVLNLSADVHNEWRLALRGPHVLWQACYGSRINFNFHCFQFISALPICVTPVYILCIISFCMYVTTHVYVSDEGSAKLMAGRNSVNRGMAARLRHAHMNSPLHACACRDCVPERKAGDTLSSRHVSSCDVTRAVGM